MKFLAVDRTKKDAGGETVNWNVTRVPTFIFLRKGKEIGRVVEKPKTTLEQDIAAHRREAANVNRRARFGIPRGAGAPT